MTGEDLGYQPSVIEQAKFDYSPLGKVFTKGLDKDKDKKEGLSKRLKNIGNKNKELLNEMNEIEKQQSQRKTIIRLEIFWFMILNTILKNTN